MSTLYRNNHCMIIMHTSLASSVVSPLSPLSKHDKTRMSMEFKDNIKSDDSVVPVLIVGAGPVGLVLSILLTELGVDNAILERNRGFPRHPQAHVINNRSIEVFRKLDGLGDEILRKQPPVNLWRNFIYCTSLTGKILGSVDHMQPQDFDGSLSPVSVAHFSQYKLIDLLLKHVLRLGFDVISSEESKTPSHDGPIHGKILMGHKCVSIRKADHGVTVTASFHKEGRKMEEEIKCNFLVGTDGAGSTVRKLVGINMKGEKDLQKMMSVHFFSHQLGEYLMNERPGMLFFIFNKDAIALLVAHDLKLGEFVLQVPFYPPQQKLQDFSPKMCERLISKLVGREVSDVDVRDVNPWVMHAQVAEQFLTCGNRVILAGDSAHRFPIAGGFGMNTGIQDAHNLAWKIASVVKGISPLSFLSTYEMERKQVACFNTALSVQNYKVFNALPAALGIDLKIADAAHRIINGTFGSILPHTLKRVMLNAIFAIGRAQVSDFILNEKNPLGSSRLARFREIIEEGKSLQLLFPAEDLGFRYLKGAVVCDDGFSVPPEAPTGRRREYIPSADPGSKLPHMNIMLSSSRSNKETFSTLDLLSIKEVGFLLIIAPIQESYHLAHAAFKIAEELKIGVKVCVIWPEHTSDYYYAKSTAALEPWTNFLDVVEVKIASSSASWWDICKRTENGAILVRPDDHIAWRTRTAITATPVLEMKRVFHTVLGIEP